MSEEKPEEEGRMKSALEIALEKTARFQREAAETRLTPEQKARIEEIEKECRAKLAEKEIMIQSKIKEVAQRAGSSEEFYSHTELMRQAFDKERTALLEEKEAKIRDIRQGKD